MTDYKYAAQQMKEAIIDEFLKKHPGVSRQQVITRTVNGRVIADTINNTFNVTQKQQAEKPQDAKLLGEIVRRGEEQLVASLDSITCSKKYVDWLFSSPTTGFDEKEKNENIQFLEKREITAGNRAVDVHKVKINLTKVVASKSKATSSLAQTLVQEYLQAVLDQLKCQKSIFDRELVLGERFSTHTTSFIEKNLKTVQPQIKPTTVQALIKAYSILKNEKMEKMAITNPKNYQQFKTELDQFNKNLKSKREQLEAIQRLIHFIETILESMGNPPSEGNAKTKTPSSSQRMAFTTKHRGR
ncbi:MAG: hypothetical protein C4527_08235 [Candidatus Omnitrophota bacterium]|jgi:hypothetical protein|nr:MAG: hypothetical protein C4527_08235 [Candidatus Omnitrophota bacterium]